MKKKIIKDTLALVAITLVAALCLSFVYQITKDKIAEAEAAERMDSFNAVYSDAKEFVPLTDEVSQWESRSTAKINEAYKVVSDSGNGCVLSVTSQNGYGGDVTLSIGFTSDCTITGVKVTSMSETSGLGANCTNETWISQFAGKNASTIGYVKNGNPGADEIDAITSATITTKAVLEAVNEGIAFAQTYLSAQAGEATK